MYSNKLTDISGMVCDRSLKLTEGRLKLSLLKLLEYPCLKKVTLLWETEGEH